MVELFSGIDEESMRSLTSCMRMRIGRYVAGERIAELSGRLEKLGVVISGSAHLELSDIDGSVTRVEEYRAGSVFGELFFLPREESYCSVEADTDCRVMFIDWERVVHPCAKVCPYHTRFLENLFLLSAEKNRQLSVYTDILSKRSLRQKLLAYFDTLRKESGSNTFTLPMSLSSLADYLCVDRSAMMREIKQLREEGFLASDKRTFTLLIQ